MYCYKVNFDCLPMLVGCINQLYSTAFIAGTRVNKTTVLFTSFKEAPWKTILTQNDHFLEDHARHLFYKAFSLALIVQICIAGLVFLGGLLDPLLGLWIVGIYFFVIGFYLMYHYLLGSLFKT